MECANVLWKYARQTQTPEEEIQEALRVLLGLDIEYVAQTLLLERAITLAVERQRSVYDALYLALAHREGATLITADERLVNAMTVVGFSLVLLREWHL